MDAHATTDDYSQTEDETTSDDEDENDDDLKMMKIEIKKLKIQQEMAAIDNAIKIYKQKSASISAYSPAAANYNVTYRQKSTPQ